MDVVDARVSTHPGPAWLQPWLAWLDAALHREILRLRARYALSSDELRGLYVGHEQVDRLVARDLPAPEVAAEMELLDADRRELLRDAAARRTPVGEAVLRLGLDEVGLLALMLCLAPEVDPGYQSVFAYLNDDAARRLPTVDLVHRLAGPGARLAPDSPVVDSGAVLVHRVETAPVWRSAGLLLAEPVRGFLLDGEADRPLSPDLTRRLLVVEHTDHDDLVATAAERIGADPVTAPPGTPDPVVSTLLAATLHNRPALLVAHEAGLVDPDGARAAWRRVRDATVPVVVGVRPEDRGRLSLAGIEHEWVPLRRPGPAERTQQWSAGLGMVAPTRSTYSWDDLVLPQATEQRLRDLVAAVRLRHEVFETWAFGRLSGGHPGIRALFSGPSGTGKTMAASIVAADLDLDLHRVDLAAVVSKFIGETEKNLERVLAAAEAGTSVLFFDEADALFGKRSEVHDAHDRYANLEVAFLLQRLEAFDGVVILATNLPGNLDNAFARRLQFHVEFPLPDQAARERLWRLAVPPQAPVSPDLDPAGLAERFTLSGGDIRSATLTAAFLAAGAGEPIGMAHVMLALARQRRQQGKLPTSAEFRGYLRLAREQGA